MRRVAVALLCSTATALVAPPTARRPTALAASATAEVPVKTFDGAGNRIAKGGEKVTVGVKGPGHNDVVVKVSDRKDGSYALKFVPPAAGLYTLTVRMGREAVGEPINVTVYRSPTAAASALKLNINGVPPINAAAGGLCVWRG